MTVIVADCIEAMAAMDECSIDAIVTDPPYDLTAGKRGGSGLSSLNVDSPAGRARIATGFMGQSWDGTGVAFDPATWAQALRVLKPGGHLLAFGGTRTSHRLVCAIEDAGFEIRDTICWLYGQGFPKSLDLSKAVDKAAGATRERIGQSTHGVGSPGFEAKDRGAIKPAGQRAVTFDLTAPATPAAERWQGWGTALKPAHEPIVVARKPLIGTVVKNVLAHGTGALNVDGCRVATDDNLNGGAYADTSVGRGEGVWRGSRASDTKSMANARAGEYEPPSGRWPANVVLAHSEGCREIGTRKVEGSGRHLPHHRRSAMGGNEVTHGRMAGVTGRDHVDEDGMETVVAWECVEDCAVRLLDEQTGTLTSGAANFIRDSSADRAGNRSAAFGAENRREGTEMVSYGDTGGASRFFYCSKTSRAERAAGLVEGLPRARSARKRRQQDATGSWAARVRNRHPTVKPIDVMRWLVRLVTPPGGVVLDPFLGSGTTGCAALLEGVAFIGVERDASYAALARARIAWWARQPAGTATKAALRPRKARAVVADQLHLEIG